MTQTAPTQRVRGPDGRVHGVVVGCRREDGRWLLIRRSKFVAAPMTVCFPGGGLEPGEKLEAAALREFREELGVGVKLVRHVWTWDATDRPLKLFGWHGEFESMELRPSPHEVHEVLWLTAEEAANHPDRLVGTELFVAQLMASAEMRLR